MYAPDLFEVLDEHLNGGCIDLRCRGLHEHPNTATNPVTSSFIEHLAEEIMLLMDKDMDY